MAQHKASMENMFHKENGKGDSTLLIDESGETENREAEDVGHHPMFLVWLEKYAYFIMMPVLPLLWCLLFLFTMDREMILSAYAMPLLGIASASLANAVPVGGGIVFVPILRYFGVKLELGAAFALATMTFGNGVFGFLTWLGKDPSSIAWHTVPYAVVPAWIGATWATFHPFLTPLHCQRLFALFCVIVAIIVGRGIYISEKRRRRNNNENTDDGGAKSFSIFYDDNKDNEDSTSELSSDELRERRRWACCLSFLTGSILVSHIAIGNAMMTFLVCSFVWKLPAKTSVVTGIVVGGWTSAVPFGIHLLVLHDVPIALWVMGLPGVYLGALIAPLVHERLGIVNVLTAFCLFLLATSLIMITT